MTKRNLIPPPSRLYHQQDMFTKKIIVSAGVSCNGKTQIHFYTSKVKVNADRHIDLLQDGLLPDVNNIYPKIILSCSRMVLHPTRADVLNSSLEFLVYIKKDDSSNLILWIITYGTS